MRSTCTKWDRSVNRGGSLRKGGSWQSNWVHCGIILNNLERSKDRHTHCFPCGSILPSRTVRTCQTLKRERIVTVIWSIESKQIEDAVCIWCVGNITSTPGSPGRPGCPATPGIPAFPLGPCTEEMNRMKLNKSQPKNDFLLLLSEHDELSKKCKNMPFIAFMKHKVERAAQGLILFGLSLWMLVESNLFSCSGRKVWRQGWWNMINSSKNYFIITNRNFNLCRDLSLSQCEDAFTCKYMVHVIQAITIL